MKKLYICPQVKWTVVSGELEMLAGSPVGQSVFNDKEASESAPVLSREDNNSFDLWNDEE